VISGLVMNTSVQRGEVIQDMMIDVVELQNEQRVRDIVTHRGQVSGRGARISLPKGTVLNSRHIRRDPVLVKGQRLPFYKNGIPSDMARIQNCPFWKGYPRNTTRNLTSMSYNISNSLFILQLDNINHHILYYFSPLY
jgi:hypothetical protein